MSEEQMNRAQLLEELEKLQAKVKTLEMSEAKYKYLFEKSQAVNMLVGKDGNILAVNNWAAELFGYDSKDLIGRDPLEFVVPEQQAKAQEQLELVLQGVSTSSFEVDIIGKGGIRTLLFAEGKGILYHKGETVGVLLSALDITEHKRAEAEATTLAIERERAGEELRESEEKYRMLVEKVQDGFFIIQDGLMIFVNEAFASMAGYTVDEVIGMDFRKLIAPEDLAMVAERYKKRQEGKPVPPTYEFRMIHKDGKTRINVHMSVGIIEYRGKVASIGTVHNITERKKAEEAILASERNYREIFNGANEIIFVHHPETGAVLDANQTACDVFGYTTDEILNLAIGELSSGEPPYSYKEAGELIQKVVKEGPQLYEWIAKDKKGRLFWCEFNLKIAVIGGEERVLAVGRDITDRKQVEEALQESENRYRTLVETLQEGLGIVDPEEKVVFANPALCDIFGYSKEEIIGMNFRDLVTKEDFQKILRETSRRKKGISSRYEVIIKRKDGELRDIRISAAPWVNEKGEFRGTIGVLLDMTEQKRAAEAVFKVQQRYEDLLNNLNVGIYRNAVDGRILEANPALVAMTEVGSKAELLKHNVTEFYHDPERRKALVDKLTKFGYIKDEVIVFVSHKGNKAWASVSAVVKKDEEGNVFIDGVLHDISERKKAEEELRESEERYRSIFTSSADALLIFDFNGNIVEASPAACEMYGYSIEEFIRLSSKDIVHPDYYHLTKQFNKDVRIKGMFRAESVNIRKDGAAFDIEVRGTKFYYAGEERLLAIVRDISERKQAEETLKQSEEKYRNLIEFFPYAIVVYDASGIIFTNSAGLKIVGAVNFEQVMGRSVKDFLHPDYYEISAGRVRQMQEGKTVSSIAIKLLRIDGGVVDVEVTSMPFTFQDKPVILTIFQDLTERKRSEEALRESEARFRSIAENIPGALYMYYLLPDGSRSEQFVGPGLEELIGKADKDESRGEIDRLLDRVHPDDKEALHRAGDAALENNKALDHEYRVKTNSGDYKWVRSIGRPVLMEDGRIRWHGVLIDVDEHRRAEERIRLLSSGVEQSSEGLTVVDLEGNILFMNKAFAASHGYTPEELIGRHLSIFHTPEQIPSVEAANRQIQETGSFIGEIWHTRRDGTVFPALMHNSPLRDEAGNPIGMIGTLRDITEIKQAEEEIRSRKEYLETIMDSSLDLIFTMKENGTFGYTNSRLKDILGYEFEDIKGRDPLAFIPKEMHPLMDEKWSELQRGISSVFETKAIKKDGSIADCLVSHSVLKGMNEYLAILKDITELKQAEKLQDSIYHISQAVEISESLDDLFRAVHKIIQDIMPAKNFFIALYDEKENLLSFPYFADEVDVSPLPREPGKELTTYVLRTGESLLCTTDVFKEMVRRGKAELIGEPSPIWLGVPLKIENRTIGVMVIQHYVNPTAYGLREQQMLEFVSAQVAKAIERKQAEEALRKSEEKYRTLFEESHDAVYISSIEGRFIKINRAGEELFGYTSGEMLEMDVHRIYANPEERSEFVQKITQDGFVRAYKLKLRRKDGEEIECLVTAVAKKADDKSTTLFQGIIHDITEIRRLEEQFRQSQKMEAIGLLAGGVAHDFNNMLTAIIGHCELGLRSLNPEDPIYLKIQEIFKAADSAAALTRQLLAFSRKQALEPKVIDLSSVISNMDKMLQRIIGENIDLRTILEPNLWKVKVDPGQIEQVIVNLAVNARDAMMSGGKLTIELANVELDEAYTKNHIGATPGPHVMLLLLYQVL